MTRHFAPVGSLVMLKSACRIFFLILLTFGNADNAASGEAASGRLTGIYEPSGVEQNGSVILIIEDEKDQALHLISGFSQDMIPSTQTLQNCGINLDDLEGITADGPYFYLAGSHLAKSDGSRRKKREVFVRLKVHGSSCEQLVFAPSLYKKLQAALSRLTGRNTTPFQINIEALAWKQKSDQLYIGLRHPLIKGKSILLILENPRELFEKKEVPVFSENPVILELAGGGIRAMSYIDDIGGYLIANETPDRAGKKQSRLWFWKGGTAPAIPLNTPAIKKLKNIEGISAIQHSTQSSVILVCDDGSLKKKKGAHFAIIPVSVLKKSIRR